MPSQARVEGDDPRWGSLIHGLPGTRREAGAAIVEALKAEGYLYLKWPMSIAEHEALAAEIGVILSRSEVRIDNARALGQERSRVVKGRPGRYGADALGFHTDNVRVDVMSMYCVEQDARDGAILLLDTNDLTDHFTPPELAILSQAALWAPELEQGGRSESFYHVAPLLTKNGDRYRVYYIPWLFGAAYDGQTRAMLKKFSEYVRRKEETGPIRLPVRPQESVFIDNHRMLHGRRAIAEDSKRHMVRFYVRLPALRGGPVTPWAGNEPVETAGGMREGDLEARS